MYIACLILTHFTVSRKPHQLPAREQIFSNYHNVYTRKYFVHVFVNLYVIRYILKLIYILFCLTVDTL
jgi:hypothetical protein